MSDPTSLPIRALHHDPRPYADLRGRFRHALGSLLPAAAVFPLVVVLEETEEYASCGPPRSDRERAALGRVQDALLAYREAYQADRGSIDPEGPERSRWSVFLDGMSAVSAVPIQPPAPRRGRRRRSGRAGYGRGSPRGLPRRSRGTTSG